MPAFKDPGFQQRQESAARAKNDALAKLKAKPPVDEAVLAERTAKRLARESAEAEKREAARLVREEAAAAKLEAARQAAAAAEALALEAEALAQVPVLTDAERKAARDARYAARKSRKSSK